MTTVTPSPVKLRTHIYKGCQRCGGVLRLERDIDSIFDPGAFHYVCLQCGRSTPLAVVMAQVSVKQEGQGYSRGL